MLKILFIGDICGKLGREATKQILPQVKKQYRPDIVIANAENIAHGKGVTDLTLNEMAVAGVDFFTGGDHSFDGPKSEELYAKRNDLIRPANFPENAPGKGYALITQGKDNILLINLIGRVFMSMDYDCPFVAVNAILANFTKQNISAIIVDIHGEATSEKVGLLRHLDGRVGAIVGTHTHVMTADQQLTAEKTAYITDVGMCGFNQGIIGIGKENILKTFLTQIKYPHVLPEKGEAIFSAVLLSFNQKSGKAIGIKPINKLINIK